MSVTINGTSGINTPAVTLPEGTVQSQLDTKLDEPDTLSLFNASGSAPVYACRAWVNFNGTGTVAIRASGNVSSITDNGTGDYTVNFTTAMEDANYSWSGGASPYTDTYLVSQNGNIVSTATGTYSTTQLRVQITRNATGAEEDFAYDMPRISVQIFR